MQARGPVVAVTAAVLLAGCTTTVVDGHPSRVGPHPSSGPAALSDRASIADPAQVKRVTAGASADVVAADAYGYTTLAADLRTGLAHTTGPYRRQYRRAFTTLVEPDARRLHASQSIQVDRIGVGSLSRSRATVLVAVRSRITQRARRARVSSATLSATVELVDGHWLLSRVLLDGGTSVSAAVGGAGLVAAATGASSGVRDLTSYRRAHFAADYARALSHTTGALHREVAGRRAKTLSTLEHDHEDLSTRIVGVAVESADGASATFLVTADGYRSTAPKTPTRQALDVTVRRVRGRWLLSRVTNVALH